MGEGKDEKKAAPAPEMAVGLQVKEGEIVMGVCHIYASFNDTFVHVTDPSGRETLVKVTGGMKVKADRDEASPYAAMLAAQDVVIKCKDLGIGGLHIKMRATVRASPSPPPSVTCTKDGVSLFRRLPFDRRLSPTLVQAVLLGFNFRCLLLHLLWLLLCLCLRGLCLCCLCLRLCCLCLRLRVCLCCLRHCRLRLQGWKEGGG